MIVLWCNCNLYVVVSSVLTISVSVMASDSPINFSELFNQEIEASVVNETDFDPINRIKSILLNYVT